MKRTNVALLAFLIGSAAAAGSGQDVSANQEAASVLKAQPQKPAPQVPESYGTNHLSFYRIGVGEFSPTELPGFDDYTNVSGPTVQWRRYGKGAYAGFLASPHLPSGAKLMGIYFNGCSHDNGSLRGAVYTCNYYASSCGVIKNYSGVQGCGSDFIDLSGTGYVVNNGPLGDSLLINLATVYTDGSDSFAGATIAYELQVSPDPAFATFTDVPAGHPFHRFVEALVAAGITGGYGDGRFGVNDPITRGQMAVFLSAALGLQFP